MAGEDFGLRQSRWRTWLRVHTPDVLYYRLGLVVPKARDCGDHDWHKVDEATDGCYHCDVTRPREAGDGLSRDPRRTVG